MSKHVGFRFAVAPMMDWTDRHCRFFHRQLTRRALLYSEMVTADAVQFGDRARLLAFDPAEHPLALQLGGSEPQKLAAAARIGADLGYDEINLNVGCPSDRVQSGAFGACLMKTPALVGECVAAMKAAVALPVTVKCRLGVDDQDPEQALDETAAAVWAAGADALWVHARKALLAGLTPKQNREIPPLDYERVCRLKAANPSRFVGLNGGLETPAMALAELGKGPVALDGAMLGRAACHNPMVLCDADRLFYGDPATAPDWAAIIAAMTDYAGGQLKTGVRMAQIVRPLVGLFCGMPGARRWRQILSVDGARPGAGPDLLARAFAEVRLDPVLRAA